MFRRMYVIIRELLFCVLLSYIKIYIVCDICQKVIYIQWL
jgi:translation initiation factor 2 beta subunit (eIF-2beta)/eIF-5